LRRNYRNVAPETTIGLAPKESRGKTPEMVVWLWEKNVVGDAGRESKTNKGGMCRQQVGYAETIRKGSLGWQKKKTRK